MTRFTFNVLLTKKYLCNFKIYAIILWLFTSVFVIILNKNLNKEQYLIFQYFFRYLLLSSIYSKCQNILWRQSNLLKENDPSMLGAKLPTFSNLVILTLVIAKSKKKKKTFCKNLFLKCHKTHKTTTLSFYRNSMHKNSSYVVFLKLTINCIH